ncbi:hypothetical protein [Arthrobacter sp. TMN-50]
MSGAPEPFRLVRSSSTSAVVLALAAGAHVIGGGNLPAPLIVAALGSATLLAVTVIAKKALSLPALLLLLGLGQLLLHHALRLTTTATACTAAPARHHAVQAVSCPSSSFQGHAETAHTDVRMLALHAAAVVVTGFMLQRGESALRRAAGWLVPLLRLPHPLALVPAPRIPAFPSVPVLRTVRALRDIPPLRGPPLASIPVFSPA